MGSGEASADIRTLITRGSLYCFVSDIDEMSGDNDDQHSRMISGGAYLDIDTQENREENLQRRE